MNFTSLKEVKYWHYPLKSKRDVAANDILSPHSEKVPSAEYGRSPAFYSHPLIPSSHQESTDSWSSVSEKMSLVCMGMRLKYGRSWRLFSWIAPLRHYWVSVLAILDLQGSLHSRTEALDRQTTGPRQPNNPASSSSPQYYLLRCVKVSTKQVVKVRVLVNKVDFTSQETFWRTHFVKKKKSPTRSSKNGGDLMYVDLGFQQYSLSDGAARAFQLSFTVLGRKKKRTGRSNHSSSWGRLNMWT